MKETTSQIDWDTLYPISKVARPSRMNPNGQGLLDMHYLTVLKHCNDGLIPHRIIMGAKNKKRFILGKDLIAYIKGVSHETTIA